MYNILMLPNDMIFYITRFLSMQEKITARETCIDFNDSIKFIEIRIGKMDIKIEKLLNGKIYILSRLRLAALCGLQAHTVADIWSWVTLVSDMKSDALPILRQLNHAIY